MEDLELLKSDLIREYKVCLKSIESSKNHIELKLKDFQPNRAPRKKQNIESIKQCRDTINRNEKVLIMIRRRFFRYFGNIDELLSLESKDKSEKVLIIRNNI